MQRHVPAPYLMASPGLADAAVSMKPGKVTHAFATPPLMRISAKRRDGKPVELLMRDWGDMRVAYDASGNAFEAYQTEWWVGGENRFVILDRNLAIDTMSGQEIRDRRKDLDFALLESMDIDIESLGSPR